MTAFCAAAHQGFCAAAHQGKVDLDPRGDIDNTNTEAVAVAATTTSPKIHDWKPCPNTLAVDPPPTPSSTGTGTGRRLSYLSALLLLLAPFLLWRFVVHQPASTAVPAVSTMNALEAFLLVTYLPLLASVVGRGVSPFPGIVIHYFSTVFATGVFSYALAEHRQSSGRDRLAAFIRRPPVCPSKENDVLFSVVSLVCAACAVQVLWVSFSYAPEDAVYAIVEFSLTVSVCLSLWMCFVHGCLLHGSLLSGNCMNLLLLDGVSGCMVSSAIFGEFFGDAGVVFVCWITAMVAAGILGYSLAIYHHYKKLQSDSNGTSSSK
ncbi:hypothetical protein ACP70R_019654 [Stipagrostis hirtigluma subsp. patula]